MHKPILIIGFERSGTTLLRRIVSMCPALEYDLLHEKKQLLEYQEKKMAEALYRYQVKEKGEETGATESILAGEKIAYRNNVSFVQRYIRRWFDWWPDGIGYHIVRDKYGCADSARRTFGRDVKKTVGIWDIAVPIVQDFCSEFKQMREISYEKLIGAPEIMLDKIYKEIGFEAPNEYLKKVLNTQDAWEFNGRKMCGLRYSNRVEKIRHD